MRKFNMLNNPIGVLLFLLLRNDISWGLMSTPDKQRILLTNKHHNVKRDDYANPEKYGAERNVGGENWDSFQLHKKDYRGQVLLKILEQNRPKNVLEIGPGAGFYTKLICQYKSVENYMAVDIGSSFLRYLQPRLEKLKDKKRFKYSLVCSEVTKLALNESFDLIVLLSTVHHIPNRMDLFNNLNGILSENGAIFCFDPSHYIFRIVRLLIKCIIKGYLRKYFYQNSRSLGTHHMCSYGEYKRISRHIPALKIKEIFYLLPKRLRQYDKFIITKKWFSSEIGIVFKKAG